MLTRKRVIKITFKSQQDYRKRIARLWQDQKEDEVYDFHFPDRETEDEYNNLMKSFKQTIESYEEI